MRSEELAAFTARERAQRQKLELTQAVHLRAAMLLCGGTALASAAFLLPRFIVA